MGNPAAHAELSPSSSDVWIYCPGSIPLIASLKLAPWTSHPARYGTAGHTILEKSLRAAGREPRDFMGKTFNIEGHAVEVDRALVDGVTTAFDKAQELIVASKAHGIEDRVTIPT